MSKKLFSFNLPDSLKKYLKNTSKENHITISQYIVDLIKNDENSKKGRLASQLKYNSLVDENCLKQMNKKCFESGRKIKIGDYVLYGFLVTSPPSTLSNRMTLKLISFHIEEFNSVYMLSKYDNTTQNIPTLKKI